MTCPLARTVRRRPFAVATEITVLGPTPASGATAVPAEME